MQKANPITFYARAEEMQISPFGGIERYREERRDTHELEKEGYQSTPQLEGIIRYGIVKDSVVHCKCPWHSQ